MAAVLETRLQQAQAEPMVPIDFLSCLVSDELTRRGDRLLERRRKQAQFRDPQVRFDNFDFDFNKKMNRSLVFDLATAAFVARHDDALFLGPPGTGKSHLAQAIGKAVINQGYRVIYREAHVLLEEIAEAALDGTRKELMEVLATVPLLIIDDLGMRKLGPTAAEELLEIVLRRYQRASTLVTSNRRPTAARIAGSSRNSSSKLIQCPWPKSSTNELGMSVWCMLCSNSSKEFQSMILRRIRQCALVVSLLLMALPLPAQQALPADLDEYVARSMKTFEVPGMAVAIVKDGKVVLSKGYGIRKLGETTTVDENTLFGIGSNTKAFTAAALATLVDEGKISWDDRVYERLKGLEMYDPYVSKEMRIRDLLCHRSGLGLGEGDLMFWPHTTFTRDEVVYRLRYLKPATSFRTTYAYNNLMFLTAGQVVADLSGKSWDDYLREKIFLPLGMNTTNTSTTTFKQGDDWAWPHSKVEGKLQPIPFENLDNAGPAGSINSSVADMSKWMLLQLNYGKIPGTDTRIFSEKSSHEMWAQQMVVPIGDAPPELKSLQRHFSGYGMGWGLRDYKGRKLVSHSGGVSGFVTRVMLVPEENLGVVILTNAEEDQAFESVLFHMLDGYLGGPTQDYISTFKTLEDKQRKEADETMRKASQARATDSKPSLPLEKYVGDYSDPWYGKVTIGPDNGGLILNFERASKGLADLQHWQYDTFKAHWRNRTVEDAFVTFTLKPDGSIDHFTMVAVSPLADFSFDYQDLYFTPVKAAEKK
jgi:CubicO group peptidase (beta-lactamase class C family)/DNA replication protein DnaC